ncbi:hypothetical protein AGMMS4952_10500 [Spirochaetia bacterium]|nr:hypothetical protein AGMMS4952_10500 [Spirochaetia bacterium]
MVTRERRKFGRRKSDYITRYLLITSLLAHVVVGAAFVQSCQMEYVEHINLPPVLPKAIFMPGDSAEGEKGQVFKDMPTFKVVWQHLPGVVDPNNNGSYTEDQLEESGAAFALAWEAFKDAIEPRPYYLVDAETGEKDFKVWTKNPKGDWKIANDYDDSRVIIERFYMMDRDPPEHGSYAERKAEYINFQSLITDTIEFVRENLEERELAFYEDTLEVMEAFVQYDPPGADAPKLPSPDDSGVSNFSKSDGRLIDYFFGAIPKTTDYYPEG